MLKYLLICVTLFLFSFSVLADGNKTYSTAHTSDAPKIDGYLDDACWKSIQATSDFKTHQPQYGLAPKYKTEVKILYDDDAVYISAKMYDDHPELIGKSLTLRDQGMDQDYFLVGFDTYHDKQNAYRFRVTASNVQSDERLKQDNLDLNWDAVWESKTKIDKEGWTVEIKVPYSAIRFPNTSSQEWGLQFGRYIKRSGEFDTWSAVDPKKSGVVSQWGNLTGIENIHPPFRLSLSPYIAGYYDKTPISINPPQYSESYSYSGGMDLKLGLNESFTLDATLIPDFGQVQSDNTVLNLSPFETKYDEKRPFFTEGTDLFQTAGIFYSRRIGGAPAGYYYVYQQLGDEEKIISNPSQARLYNATKLTGRTNKGLGIGVLNAVQAPTYADVEDGVTGAQRKIQTDVLTNYDVFVLNQTLKNNSGVTVINTNVLRRGEAPDANVTALDFNINDKKNYYSFYGTGIYSRQFDAMLPDSLSGGVNYSINFSKISGKFRFDLFEAGVSSNYNPNDLGINFSTNQRNHFVGLKYIDNDMHKHIQNWDCYIGNNYSMNYSTGAYYDLNINFGGNITFKNFWSVGMDGQSKPFWYYDYYEPRVAGMKFKHAPYVYFNPKISTDYRKQFTVTVWGEYAESPQPKDPLYGFGWAPAWQVTDWLNISSTTNYTFDHANWGYVDFIDTSNTVIMGKRNTVTITNDLSMQVLFTPHMNLSLRTRHYWSNVQYLQYYSLKDDGNLDSTNYTGNNNINFNAWNVDVVYAWQFAPGSFLNLIWKVNLLNADQQNSLNYFHNFRDTVQLPAGNTIALKMIYYLDYQKFKKIFS